MKPPKTKRKRKRPPRIGRGVVRMVIEILRDIGAKPEHERFDDQSGGAVAIPVEAWVLDLIASALLAVLDVMPPEPAPRGPKPKDRDILLKLRRDHPDHSKTDVAMVVAAREVLPYFAERAVFTERRIKQRVEAGEKEAKVRREEEKKLKILFAELKESSETRIESLKRKIHPSRQGRPTKLK